MFLNEPINSVELHIKDKNLSAIDFRLLKELVQEFSFCMVFIYDHFHDYYREDKTLKSLNVIFKSTSELTQKDTFFINIKSYLESLESNLYYNQKLFIDKIGNIKNSMKSDKSFGNISELFYSEEIVSIVKTEDFKILWNASKSNCDICKDCEFRNICNDDRLPFQRKVSNEWFYNEECNYNPYIAKWSDDEGYLNLEQCGVISNEKGFSIDHDKIAEVNTVLWEEEEIENK